MSQVVWGVGSGIDAAAQWCGRMAAMNEPERNPEAGEDNLSPELIAQNPVGALRAAIAALEEAGLLPADWETREGDPICAARWNHEVFQRMGEAMDWEKLGEAARYREALASTCEAAEIYLDRVLSLTPEERAPLTEDAVGMREKLRQMLQEQTGE